MLYWRILEMPSDVQDAERKKVSVISLRAPGGASEAGMGWGVPEDILEMLLSQASLPGAGTG